MATRTRKPKDAQGATIESLVRDRPAAHEVIFAGPRHKNARPPFHIELIKDFHSFEEHLRFLVWIVFRGGAKSTIAEEGVAIQGWLREFQHAFLIGASQPKAQERLHAIRRMYEKNEIGRAVFGDVKGQPWGDDRLELSTGQTIQAMGRGQAIRGTKNEDFRPDLIIVDDIENASNYRSNDPDVRKATADWFMDELLPSGDTNLRVRMLANDTHPECLANSLSREGSGFIVKRYPWVYKDRETGAETATWADRFPLKEVHRVRDQYFSQGKASLYNSNYLCRSESPEDKPFRREMFRYAGRDGIDPAVRTWQPVYAMIDPARTTRATSATTGWAVWSRIEGRLIVWDSGAKRLMPDEIIKLMFEIDDTWSPVKIGFEEDGLNQWALQPIRQEQAKRGMVLPVVAIKAPPGKDDFIRGLQFGFNARETIFAKSMPELEAQLLGFPSGHKDAPNALAYEHHQKLAPGIPMYEDFMARHAVPAFAPAAGKPLWLCLNASAGMVTAVLVQQIDGCLRIIADWVREGDPGAVARDIHREAVLQCDRGYTAVAGPEHFEWNSNHGLVQAYKSFRSEVRRCPQPETGRRVLRELLLRTVRDRPAIQVSHAARWTLNGFAGGYARALVRSQIQDYPEDGVYRLLLEGLESFAGMMQTAGDGDAADTLVNATASDGRRFFSAVAHRRDAQGG